MGNSISENLFEESCRLMPGGVNSPVRSFRDVGGVPPVIVRGEGSKIYDADDNIYIDFIGAYGAAILGHAHPKLVAAIQKAASLGFSYGAPTEWELRLASMIIDAIPGIEKIRFVSSGTEACMSAIRVARAATRRSKIIKFEGGYHGHADHLLVKSAGVPEDFLKHTLVATYNDLTSVEKLFDSWGRDVAAVIVEPVAANRGLVLPQDGFLSGLRGLCDRWGALLIFDEVITGFRFSFGAVSGNFGVKPDLMTLGKVIGGGLPIGAYSGKKELMDLVAPLGPVYQAGTLSGNCLSMVAGIKALEILSVPGIYSHLAELTEELTIGLRKNFAVASMGPMFWISFAHGHREKFASLFHHFLENGIHLPPSPYETCFIGLAHTREDIQKTIDVASLWQGLP